MIETTNADGSLNANGYAIHLAYDLEEYGFDGVDINPMDAALILARFIREN